MYINDTFSILHTYIQSINGRKNSLLTIANSLNIDLVTINETNLKGKNNLKLEGFNCYTKNRKSGNMGGVATCVKNKHEANTLKVSEGKTCEFIVTRHDQFNPAINVVNIYGSQESRKSSAEIRQEWEEILKVIIDVQTKNEQ